MCVFFVRCVKNKGMIPSLQCSLYLLVMWLYLACSSFLWTLSLSLSLTRSHTNTHIFSLIHFLITLAVTFSHPSSLTHYHYGNNVYWKSSLGSPEAKKMVHGKHTPHNQSCTHTLSGYYENSHKRRHTPWYEMFLDWAQSASIEVDMMRWCDSRSPPLDVVGKSSFHVGFSPLKFTRCDFKHCKLFWSIFHTSGSSSCFDIIQFVIVFVCKFIRLITLLVEVQ